MSHQKQKKVIHSIRTEVDSFGRKKYRLQQQVIQSGQEQQHHDKQNATVVDIERHKSMLIGRQEELNIDKYIGKIDTNKKKKVSEVFYCDICSEGFKCDMAYITHINSPAHNRKLGMNMKVKSVSLETVSSKISSLVNKKLGKEKQQQDEEVEDELIRRLQGGNDGDDGIVRRRVNNNSNGSQNEITKRQLGEDDCNDSESEQQVKQQEQPKVEEEQQQQEQQQQDSNELAQQQMMLMMGIGSKKIKR